MYSYDQQFFHYTNRISARSAQVIVPLLYDALHPKSVIDLGCGCGTWLAQWIESGATDVVGVDGPYVSRADLVIPSQCFIARDLSSPIDLGRRFDLAQSLEVAEHLPDARARSFVQDLCRHADIVLFGAAPPGQGGENHVNEQPYGYWRDRFAEQDYDAYDFIRPRILQRREVASWHRYNPILYVKRAKASLLAPSVRRSRIAPSAPVRDLSPALYRARKALVRRLPPWASHALAHARKRLAR